MIRTTTSLRLRKFVKKVWAGTSIMNPKSPYPQKSLHPTARTAFEKLDQDLQSLGLNINEEEKPVGGVLSEFFYPKEHYQHFLDENEGELEIVSGTEYPLEALRQMTVVELQSLWFSLLKERNRLYTARYEYGRNMMPLPSGHRLDIVAKSMDNLRTVLEEMEQARNTYLTGSPEKIKGTLAYSFTGEHSIKKEREYPIPKDANFDHIIEHAIDKDPHPDAKIDHHVVREWKLRKEETKYQETNEFYKYLNQKWATYVAANPEKSLPENPPKWWLDLDVNQPKYRNQMWIKNLPLVDDNLKERKKITQNAPGDPNI